MYAFNWDASYSTDGGRTWVELDPHTVFPTPTVGGAQAGFGCDQVVQYDPKTKVFIWALQYQCSNVGVNLIRIAWASASRLERYGAKAWSRFDLDPAAIAGKDNTFLDQPRLAFTNTFLYISLNQGAVTFNTNGTAKGELQHAVVVRIPRMAFASTQGHLPFGWAVVDPVSLRVAQNVHGSMEYFVGHNGTSQLRVAWIDDNSNSIDYQDIDSPTIATDDFSSNTPGGQDMLLHQSTVQGTAVTGLTQAGDGTVWAAWTEGRKLPNGTGQYAQPHVGVAVLQPIPGQTGFLLQSAERIRQPSLHLLAAGPRDRRQRRGRVRRGMGWRRPVLRKPRRRLLTTARSPHQRL
jgi:hypothetical protein